MYKTAQADLDARPLAVLHSFDVSNAHNEYERVDAIRAISELCPDMLPWVNAELTTPTVHVYIGLNGSKLTIPKDRGGDQGDPIVGLIFPLTYHRVIHATESAAKNHDSRARAYSYQDDVDLVTNPNGCCDASTAFVAACHGIGLRANHAKEKVSSGREALLARRFG